MSEKRVLTVSMGIDEARELYKKANPPFLNKLLLSIFTKEELEGLKLPQWSELRNLEGFYINSSGHISFSRCYFIKEFSPSVFAKESQARSALAMAQLSQLMAALGDECRVDWDNYNHLKYVVYRYNNEIMGNTYHAGSYQFMAFKTKEVRDAFLEKHIDLIKQYFEL